MYTKGERCWSVANLHTGGPRLLLGHLVRLHVDHAEVLVVVNRRRSAAAPARADGVATGRSTQRRLAIDLFLSHLLHSRARTPH